MANWQKKFKCWEQQLQDYTPDSTFKCVQEIKRTVDAISKQDERATLVCKILNLVCRALNIQAGIELFTILSKHIFDKFWASFISNIKYFTGVLCSRKMWNEAADLRPIIEKCDINEATCKDLFQIHSNYYVALIVYKQVPENNFKSCSERLAEIITFVRRKNKSEYLDTIYELLVSKRNFQICILKMLEGTGSFLSSVANDLAKCDSVNHVCDRYDKLCTISIFLTAVDLRNQSKFTLLFVKAFMSAIKNDETQPDSGIFAKLCMLISFLIKIFIEKDMEKFNEHLIDILNKLSRLLEMGKTDDSWSSCGFYLICKILFRFSAEISEKLDRDNIGSMFKVMEMLLVLADRNNASSSYCSKTYCLECDDLSIHINWNLLHLQTIIMNRSIVFNITNTKHERLLVNILSRAMESYSDAKCAELKVHIQNCFREAYLLIQQSRQNQRCASLSLKLLDKWRKTQNAREHFNEKQLVYQYKQLLKLEGSHRKALEMHCLYVIHLISEKSKQKIILDEIALCCAEYAEAKVDYEQSICEIIDKANIDLKIPSYDPKLLLRYQLQACTTYAGIDLKLKNYLAKKVFEETDDDIELSEVISIIGKISFPEMPTKIENGIKSLKRKIVFNKQNYKKHLALAKLLLRQYKLILEKIKESTTVKSFGEVILHETDLDFYKKLDVCSENKILSHLRGAKEHFSIFYNTADIAASDINWDQIIDDISSVARHFTLRGYLDESYECWLLIYRIAKQFNLILPKIRAVSFFADFSEVIPKADSIDLESTINDVSSDILIYYEQLEKQGPRQQNYILLAVINIASYYLKNNKLMNSQLLVELARRGRDKLIGRENSIDLITVSLLAYNFNMIISSCDKDANLPSPYIYVHSIIDAIVNVKHMTSEDSINVPTFLFRLVMDLAHFSLYRLCAASIRPFLYTLMQCAAEFSLSFRLAQIVSLLAMIDLQMERMDKCDPKLIILNTLLNKTSESVNSMKQNATKSKANFLTPNFIDAYDLAIEPARRVPLSPKNFIQPYKPFNQAKTSEYLLDHPGNCICDFCRNPLFKLVSFQVGCLQAQNHYIIDDLRSSETFYEQSLNWWKSNLQTSPTVQFYAFNSIFYSLINHINTLRRLREFEKAVPIIEEAKIFLKQSGKYQDPTYMHIIVEAEICVAYMIQSNHKMNNILIAEPSNIFETPVRPVTSRGKPLPQITTKNTSESSASNDLDVVPNLISDLKISETENDKNLPVFEADAGLEVQKPKIKKRIGQTSKAKVSSRSVKGVSSTKEDDESQKENTNKIESSESNSNDKVSVTKTSVRAKAKNAVKKSAQVDQSTNARVTRMRKNLC